MNDTQKSKPISELATTKFYKWLYNEVKNKELVTLGPFRFVSEHKSQKFACITPDQWLPRMAKLMEDKGVDMSLEQVAEDFNELIDNGSIEDWIVRSNKYIALSIIEKHENSNSDKGN